MTRIAAPGALALALLLGASAARAAPATVTQFEAQVRARPDPAAPVVHTFPEGARVSVSEGVTDGYRRIRLPDGRVGYVEDGAVSLAAPPSQPPTTAQPPAAPPPPGAPPPPPDYVPPPPPGWAPYRPYRARPVLYLDPDAHRHRGFFLRFDLGLGYLGTSTSSTATSLAFDASHGAAGQASVAIGGAVAENFILAGHFWGSWVASPTLRSGGASVPTGGDFSTSLVGIGPSLDWYWMPQNVYFEVTPSLTWVNFSDFYGGFTTAAGFGTRLALGKEWWVGPHWGIGLSGWFAASFNRESGGAGPWWRTYTGGLAFSMTFN